MERTVTLPCFEGINKMTINENEKQIVMITKCSNDGARYESMVGEKIEVSYFPTDRLYFEIPEENFKGFISIEDTDISDGKLYSVYQMLSYDENTFFINLTYSANQAMIVSYDCDTNLFKDISRKEIRFFSPDELLKRDNSYGGKEWTKLVKDFFTLKIN